MNLSERYPGEMLPVKAIRMDRQAGHAIIDPEDYEKASPYYWRAYGDVHTPQLRRVSAWIPDRGIRLSLAKFLTGWELTGHANGNPYDCRRFNLCKNSLRRTRRDSRSRFKGVGYMHGRWMSRIRFHGELYFLGYYDEEEDAARAYDKKALELIGPDAMTNDRMGLYEVY